MAKPKKSSAFGNKTYKKPQTKEDKFLIYKALTKYVITRDEKILEFLLKDKKQTDTLRNRIVTHFYGHLKLMWYVSTYLNNLYDQTKWSDEEWFKMFGDIANIMGVNEMSQLYFSKYKTNSYSDFANLIRKYYEATNQLPPSSGDIQALYILRTSGKITDDILEDITLVAEGQAPKNKVNIGKKTTDFVNYNPIEQNTIEINTKDKTFKDLSPKIQEFCNHAITYVKQNKNCYGCELRGKPPVILDTNLTEPGEVDVLFISLNPNVLDAEKNIPMSNGSGLLFRDYFDKILTSLPNLKYAITNAILCSSQSDQIQNTLKTGKQCSHVVNIIRQQFPAKLIVLIGDKTSKIFGVKGSVSKLTGTIEDGYFILINPSSCLKNNNYKKSFEDSFSKLFEILSNKNTNSEEIKIDEINVTENKFVNRLNSNLTLFDIREVNEKILYILKDPNGNKVYHFEDIKLPVYIKFGQYKNCPFISTEADAVVYLNSQQKDIINKRLYQNVKNQTSF